MDSNETILNIITNIKNITYKITNNICQKNSKIEHISDIPIFNKKDDIVAIINKILVIITKLQNIEKNIGVIEGLSEEEEKQNAIILQQYIENIKKQKG